MVQNLRNNVWKIALSDVFYRFGVIWSIYILYFNYLGFNFQHIGLFEGITSFVIVASDLFTGVIADRAGRKLSLLISNVSFLLMTILLAVSNWLPRGSIAIIIICGVLNGLEFSFRSGAKSAFLYDTLLQLNQVEEYLKVNGRLNALGIISNVAGMVLGGYLFTKTPSLPYWIWAGCIVVSTTILLTAQEPLHRKPVEKLSFWEEIKFGVKFIFQTKTLLIMVVFALFADVFAESYWDIYSQAHIESLGAPYTGVIFGVIGGLCAVASYFIDRIENKVGQKWMLYGIIGIQSIMFILIGWLRSWIGIGVVLIIFNINRNFTWLVTETYENKLIPSKHRASILSAASFLRNGVFGGGIIIWIIGLLIDHVDKSILFTIIAFLVLGINGILLAVWNTRTQRNQRIDHLQA